MHYNHLSLCLQVNDVFKRSISQSSDGLTDFSIRFGNNGGTLSSSSIIEHLQSALKQKEGELTSAQNMVASLERSRTGLTEDLALLSEKNQQLEERVNIIPQLQEKLAVSEETCNLINYLIRK